MVSPSWSAYKETPRIDILPKTFFWMVVLKVIKTGRKNFTVDIKSTILPQLISLWCFYYIFLESFKNGVHKNFLKSTKSHLNRGPLRNKAAEWSSATFLNRDSGTGAFLRIFVKLQEHLFCKRRRGQISF